MKDLIRNDDIAAVSCAVLRQKLRADQDAVFATSLTADAEEEIARRLIESDKKDEWADFLIEYVNHFNLWNSTVDFLLDYVEKGNVQKVLLADFNRYGYNEAQATAICTKARSEGIDNYSDLLEAVVSKCRVMSPQVLTLLDLLDARYAEIYGSESRHYAERYKANAFEYRKKNQLLGFV